MEMKDHLSEQQWGELLTPPNASPQHLAECSECHEEHKRLQELMSVLPEWARSTDQQPEIFWARQSAGIRSRIAQLPERRRSARLVWAIAVGIILLASFLLRTGSVRIPRHRCQVDADHELLVAVEQVLDGDVPEALQPASLLTEEMTRTPKSNSHSDIPKEKTHEY